MQRDPGPPSIKISTRTRRTTEPSSDWLSVSTPDVMIGQLGGEGGLGRGEKNETAPSASDTGRPTHSVNVLRHCCGGRILRKNPQNLDTLISWQVVTCGSITP